MPQPAVTLMPADDAARLAEFARACKAAARAVSLYPGAHPAIAASLSKLSETTARLSEGGPFRLQVGSDRLTVNGAIPAKPDPAIAELASLLHRHFIGAMTLNPGADASSWRALLLLLARTPEEVRADGGIAKLWTTAGGPSLEIQEIDYAEVLREKQGQEAALDEIIAAALGAPKLQMDDSGMRLLVEIVGDPARLRELMKKIETAAASGGADAQTAAFLSILRGLAEWIGRNDPERLESVMGNISQAAGHLSADAMLHLLQERTRADAAAGDVAGAVVDRMTDASVSQFVSGSVIAEGGPTDRLAQAFQALAPDPERQRKLLALAETEVAASELGNDADGFADLWKRVESLLTSYSDKSWVSDEYGRELSSARAQAVDVERISDDPPERIAALAGNRQRRGASAARHRSAGRSAGHREGSAAMAGCRRYGHALRGRPRARRAIRSSLASRRHGRAGIGNGCDTPHGGAAGTGSVWTRRDHETRGCAPAQCG